VSLVVVPVLSAVGLSALTGQELVNTEVRTLERGGERAVVSVGW